MSEEQTPQTTIESDLKDQQPEPEQAQEDVVAEQPKENDRISLRIVGQDGGEVYFKVRSNTPFHKIAKAYCDRKGVSAQSIRFLFDGQRINDDDNAEKLGLQDDDVIDALLQQVGGWLFF